MEELKSSKMVIDFIGSAIHANEQYRQEKAKLKKKLVDGVLTNKGFRQKEQDLISKIAEPMDKKRKNILSQIESERSEIKEIVQANKTSLTSEDVELLNFLAGVETLTGDDLKPYQLQYKNKPLALKRIDEIAKAKDILLPSLVDELEEANKLLDILERDAETFATTYNPTTDGGDTSVYTAMASAFIDTIVTKTQAVDELFGFSSTDDAVQNAERFIKEFDKENNYQPTFQDKMREIIAETGFKSIG